MRRLPSSDSGLPSGGRRGLLVWAQAPSTAIPRAFPPQTSSQTTPGAPPTRVMTYMRDSLQSFSPHCIFCSSSFLSFRSKVGGWAHVPLL
ncbi:hypothetical protein C2E23DRAFT_848167, partial [Lenzites betulinus]